MHHFLWLVNTSDLLASGVQKKLTHGLCFLRSGNEYMTFGFLVSANMVNRLVQVNGMQKSPLKKIPDLDGTIKGCGY